METKIVPFISPFLQSDHLTSDALGYPVEESGLCDDMDIRASSRDGFVAIDQVAAESDEPSEDGLTEAEMYTVDFDKVEALVCLYVAALDTRYGKPSTGPGLIRRRPSDRRRPTLSEVRARLYRPVAPKPAAPKEIVVVAQKPTAIDCRHPGCVAKVLSDRGYCVSHGGQHRFKTERAAKPAPAAKVSSPVALPARKPGPSSLRMANRDRRAQSARQ